MYGCYPECHSMPGDADRSAYLHALHSSYLFKDILERGGVRHPRKIFDLLRLIAFQLGSEVSFSELGSSLGMSKDTVASYIDLLEKAFILFRLPGYSRNLRSEVTRSPKIYFHDNGVQNAAINDFRPFREQPDKGALWENFLISERNKMVTLDSSHARLVWEKHSRASCEGLVKSRLIEKVSLNSKPPRLRSLRFPLMTRRRSRISGLPLAYLRLFLPKSSELPKRP